MGALVSLALAVSVATTGGLFSKSKGNKVMPPGPGYGIGFPNGNPDGYGWVDYGTNLPIGGDRTPDYFFQRQFSVPPGQMFLPTYYNVYTTRGQRYLPYVGCGGDHPAGKAPLAGGTTPEHPYAENANYQPVVAPPRYSGRVGAPPVGTGTTGLIP